MAGWDCLQRGMKNILGDGNVQFLVGGDRCMKFPLSKPINLQKLNLCILFYVNYMLIRVCGDNKISYQRLLSVWVQRMKTGRQMNVWLPSSPPTVFGQIRGSSVQFSSITQSCPTLCDPMNCSMPGLPVHHQLLEFTQTHIHRVSDAIQPSHPLSSPSPPAPNPSQHQDLFQ